ncbi:citrate synthase-lysine N-methyltransferase CSKMT, mitochondrial isoform X1 [Esox lucius]|uniref:citrate synthase-lysine N-methyltransferase CSKMT, mitochondrial isoform X1 n=1 Tax=Esox lucius TaxID=8010 RepID=UPI001477370E|nr:citrate synthase-lysine N-methyltransferase CSKMT, mitochondrial isoform X1 [Esox lucius]
MALILNMLTRSCGKLITTTRLRHHSSLTAELINNMDKKATWDRFYTENNSEAANFKNFEWFFGFDAIRDFVLPVLYSRPKSEASLRILDMGCGTSALGPSVYRESVWPVQVTCADISPVAVRLMRNHTKTKAVQPQNISSKLDFLELDCTHLHEHYVSESLDLILDKGTIDALLRSRDGGAKASQVLKQCLMALRNSGSLLQFSDEDPDSRMLWLEREAREPGLIAADVGVQEVGELRGVTYYCYQVSPRPAAQ